MAKRKKRRRTRFWSRFRFWSGFHFSPAAVRKLFWLALLVLLGGLVLFFTLRSRGRSDLLARHESSLKEYLSFTPAGEVPPEQYVTGKLVTVDRSLRVLDPTFLELSSALRADGPADVGTIVFLEWELKDTGQVVVQKGMDPRLGSRVYDKTCKITAVDRATRQVTAQTTVSSRANQEKVVVEDIYEGNPIAKVVSFLNSLPRK